jgi:prolyl 4-hydroxylase|tara:strand:+ start:318 stop:1295 length:978 start_codon:yes stop_codon:yes gene_type:complete
MPSMPRNTMVKAQQAVAQNAGPGVAPAHLRTTMTPVPAEVFGEGGMSLVDNPGMALGFGDLTEHDFFRVNTDTPGLKVLHIDPPILTIDGFLTAEACDALIKAAGESGLMKTSGVGGAANENIRTSKTCTLDSELLTDHPTKAAILQATENALPQLKGLKASKTAFQKPTSLSPWSYELPQVAHYQGGEYFKTHEDGFPENVSQKKGYQRRATVLVYLNDVEKGGATRFDKLGIDVQPVKGKALIFFPGTDASMPDGRTLHTATEAIDEKWISQLWVCGFAGKHATAGQPPGPGDRAARRAQDKETKKAAKKAGGGGRGGRKGSA